MTSRLYQRLSELGLQEATLRHRDDPTWIEISHLTHAELARWTFVDSALNRQQSSEQSRALAKVGIYAVSFVKGAARWRVTYAVPPDVSLAAA